MSGWNSTFHRPRYLKASACLTELESWRWVVRLIYIPQHYGSHHLSCAQCCPFLITSYQDVLGSRVFVKSTFGAKYNYTALFCLAPIKDLKSRVGSWDFYSKMQQTMSCIFSLTNCSTCSRCVIVFEIVSPLGPGSSTVLRVPMGGDVSTRNMVTVYFVL